jgi:hypothetical protein
MNSFYLKKWYVDLVTADGDALYLYFIVTRVAGIRRNYVSAHLSLANGSDIRATHRYLELGEGVVLERNHVIKRNNNSHTKIHFENIAVDLWYSSIGSKWTPTEKGILLRSNEGYLSWFVSQPAAAVEGTIHFGPRKMEVRGFGYQDIVEMTIPPWRLPISELLWGRAHCGNYTVVYDQVKTREGDCLQYLLLQDRTANLVEDRIFTIQADAADNETQIIHKTFTLNLKRRRMLEESPIATDERIKPRFFRNLLARISGNPQERKMFSDAVLRIGETVLHGTAIHEKVLWHWKGDSKNEY